VQPDPGHRRTVARRGERMMHLHAVGGGMSAYAAEFVDVRIWKRMGHGREREASSHASARHSLRSSGSDSVSASYRPIMFVGCFGRARILFFRAIYACTSRTSRDACARCHVYIIGCSG
jgi:hypothetical protein